MALITCPNCGKTISDKALDCPKCGYNLTDKSCNNLPKSNNNINEEKVDKPAMESALITEEGEDKLAIEGDYIKGKGANKPTKNSNTIRKVIIATLVFFAITQMILIVVIASKNCTRTQDNSIAHSMTEQTDESNQQNVEADNSLSREYAVVTAPIIPDSVMFCGETIKFDRIDMAERLDRELINTIYNHSQTSLIIKRANRIFPMLIKLLKENNIPEDMVYLAVAESALDANAESVKGVWGLRQKTAEEFGLDIDADVDERYNIEKSTVAACKYFKKAFEKYGKWATVCTSYKIDKIDHDNNIDTLQIKQKENNVFNLRLVSETSRYVFRILAYKIFLSNPKQFGYCLHENQLYQPFKYDVVVVNTPVDSWVTWAVEHDITYAQLREANPWIRRNKLPNNSGKVYKVKVPKHDSFYRSKTENRIFNYKWVVD